MEQFKNDFQSFDYRITPHATTGIAPCELLIKKLRSQFDLLYPEIGEETIETEWESWWKGWIEQVCQRLGSLCWELHQEKSEMDTWHDHQDHRTIAIRDPVTRRNKGEETLSTTWERGKYVPNSSERVRHKNPCCTSWTHPDARSECSSWKWWLLFTRDNSTYCKVTSPTTLGIVV